MLGPPTQRNSYGHTILHAITRGNDSLSLLEALVKAGVEINAIDYSGETAFGTTEVALEKYNDCVRYFLDNGADMACVTEGTDNMLHHATKYLHPCLCYPRIDSLIEFL